MNGFFRIFRATFFPSRDPFAQPNFDFLKLARVDFLIALMQRRLR